MTAVEILEKIGTDASLQAGRHDFAAQIKEPGDTSHKIWCILFPEKDGDEDSEEKDSEDKTEINFH